MDIKEDTATMRKGRVFVMKNGKLMPLEQGLTATDGSRIMPDGTVRMADGTTRMMEEGETMTIAGEVPEMNETPDRTSGREEM
jgi:hypothetical protein